MLSTSEKEAVRRGLGSIVYHFVLHATAEVERHILHLSDSQLLPWGAKMNFTELLNDVQSMAEQRNKYLAHN